MSMDYIYNNCLLIDDGQIDNFINEKVIKLNFFARNITVTQSPEKALNLIINSNYLPEVIFLDIHMPGLDGFDFLQEYDKLQIDKNKINIYMLSSTINPADFNRVKEQKYVIRLLRKPLTKEILSELSSHSKLKNDQQF